MLAKEGKREVFRANCQLDKFSFYNKGCILKIYLE